MTDQRIETVHAIVVMGCLPAQFGVIDAHVGERFDVPSSERRFRKVVHLRDERTVGIWIIDHEEERILGSIHEFASQLRVSTKFLAIKVGRWDFLIVERESGGRIDVQLTDDPCSIAGLF